MKQVLVLLICMMVAMPLVHAQKGKVFAAKSSLDMGDVDAAKKAIDPALEEEKSKVWAFTYLIAGDVYRELYKKGMDADGLKKAVAFYTKASELDQLGDEKGKGKGKYEGELFMRVTTFKNELINSGVDGFNKNDFNQAIEAFESVLAISKLANPSATATVDTAVIYNIALAAYNGEKYDVAKKYFKEAIKYSYGGGDAFLLLHQTYGQLNDTLSMGSNLKMGFEKYPDDIRILTTLIRYYLSVNKNEEALEYLNEAIERDGNNASFYYARGVLNDQSKRLEDAKADYLKCLEIDGNDFNALYNLGVLYYNEGVEKHNKANDITDMKKYDIAKKEANSYFEKALPYMEKARDVLSTKENATKEEKIAVYESLKNLYYRFDNIKAYEEAKKVLDEL